MSLKAAVSVHRRIAEIGREAWDACAANPEHAGNPFVAYDFLDIAEESGCAVERTGWGPQHLSVEDEAGHVEARIVEKADAAPKKAAAKKDDAGEAKAAPKKAAAKKEKDAE